MFLLIAWVIVHIAVPCNILHRTKQVNASLIALSLATLRLANSVTSGASIARVLLFSNA